MEALVAGLGVKVVAVCGAAIMGIVALFFGYKSVQNSGEEKQQAIDLKKGNDDNVKASEARSNVSGLSSDSIDARLRADQRK